MWAARNEKPRFRLLMLKDPAFWYDAFIVTFVWVIWLAVIVKCGFSDIVRFTYDVFVAYIWYAYKVTLVPTAQGEVIVVDVVELMYFVSTILEITTLLIVTLYSVTPLTLIVCISGLIKVILDALIEKSVKLIDFAVTVPDVTAAYETPETMLIAAKAIAIVINLFLLAWIFFVLSINLDIYITFYSKLLIGTYINMTTWKLSLLISV